jgi:hypothetical protein
MRRQSTTIMESRSPEPAAGPLSTWPWARSTLAGPLAAELELSLLGKDPIKEELHDVLGADRHPVHVLTSLSPEAIAEYDQPVGVGELITVDTTVPVDVGAVADRVRASLRAPV